MKRVLVSLAVVALLALAGCTAPPRIASPEEVALKGSAWKLESWAAEAQDPSAQELYLEFAEEGKEAKIYSAGSVHDASYDFGVGNSFAFSDLPAVLYPGADEKQNQAERIFFDFLAQTRGYRLEGNKLILEDKVQADLMTFVPVQ